MRTPRMLDSLSAQPCDHLTITAHRSRERLTAEVRSEGDIFAVAVRRELQPMTSNGVLSDYACSAFCGCLPTVC